jgi:hypothetical protein
MNEGGAQKRLHPVLTGEMGLQKAVMFNQGANIGLPDIYFIN